MLLPTPSPRASPRRARPSRARAARDLDAGDATSDSAGVAVLALYEEAAERLQDKKSRTAFATAFGAALLANRGPAPAPGASFKSLIKGAEDTLAAWKAAGWTKDAKITFEGSADLTEAADDFASGYEVKTSVALGGAASCLADACLEERGIAWHPDPCCLALASYLAQSKVSTRSDAPQIRRVPARRRVSRRPAGVPAVDAAGVVCCGEVICCVPCTSIDFGEGSSRSRRREHTTSSASTCRAEFPRVRSRRTLRRVSPRPNADLHDHAAACAARRIPLRSCLLYPPQPAPPAAARPRRRWPRGRAAA